MPFEIIFPQAEKPKTVENFLKKRFPIGYVRKLFRKNAVRLNGARSGAKEMAGPGDKILLFIPFEKRARTTQHKITLKEFESIFEDDDLLVINKRAGIAVHEARGVLKRHTILGILEALYRPFGITPLLVHRIDRDTSGLLVVAKNREVAEDLERKFEEGRAEKAYLVLVAGKLFPKRGRIDIPLPGRDGGTVPALTLYKVDREFPGVTLVRVTAKTGRMHQIRLHFAKLGHPLVMDERHGDFAFNKRFRKAHPLRRQFLHACRIALEYRGRKRQWSAPLPDDLTQTLKSLEFS